jgi:cation diffusion facilitator family transporter
MPPHQHDLRPFEHSHVFDHGNPQGEARTRWVLALTLLTMVGEVAVGWWTNSMALLADGWHMGTHALALGVAVLAYGLARRHARDPRYAFGPWKIEVLAGFASALALALVAVAIAAESLTRLWSPQLIAARMALQVAVLGLVVNLLSAWLLHGADGGHADHHHDHEPGHVHDHHQGQGHPQGGSDLNLRAAYVHVLADALTSVLAIAALLGALWWGWWWLDPVVGLLGAAVIAVWAVGLLRQSARVLLDREMDHPIVAEVRSALQADGDTQVADLHLWRVGREQFALVACVVADAPFTADEYRARLAPLRPIVHATIEVQRCPQAGG